MLDNGEPSSPHAGTRTFTLSIQVSVMTRNYWFAAVGLIAIALSAPRLIVAATNADAAANNATPATISNNASATDFFDAVESGQLGAKLLVFNDHAARLILTNNTKQPLNLKMPEAFAGVPVMAQFGGGGVGGGGARGGGGRTTTGGGGGQQSIGGGGGAFGGGGGGLGGGGGGGFFSVPAEKIQKLDFPVLCLDHGLREPSTATAYKIVPAEAVLDRGPVVELLKAFGRGELKHQAAQAAAWNLNNGMSWNQLAAKLDGTRRSLRRSPYFTADDIRTGMSYAAAATNLAASNADEYAAKKKAYAEKQKSAKVESSDKRSTTDSASNEPEKTDSAATTSDTDKPETDK
jgi:hypothetical protein